MSQSLKADTTTSKTANQAWRKKPRRFAPKTRLGCKTCKIRRVKCDLATPSCDKCRSTGRKCDGYGHVQKLEAAGQPPRLSHHTGPLMVLSTSGQTEGLAMYFFEYVSIKHLNEFRPSDAWRGTLMYYAQTVPAVRHAATALALVHRDHLDHDGGGSVYQLQASKGRQAYDTPLVHYNRAIQLLLNQQGTDSIEATATTLLVCYLFMSFDLLASNYVQATGHLRGGVELAETIERTMSKNKTLRPSAHSLVISQVTEQIRRLDMQAVTFLVDWTPGISRESLVTWIPARDDAFASLDQAADHMQILVARVMRLRHAVQDPAAETTMVSPALIEAALHAQLERWWRLFEQLLCQLCFSKEGLQKEANGEDAEPHPLISLLRLQYTIAWTLLSTQGSGTEMEYDLFLPQFQQCLALARNVAAAHARYAGSTKPTFTPEIGFIPVLYIIGAKCRDPRVRRGAVGILRQQPMREAVWDSTIAAMVVERMIEVEEGGRGGADQGWRVESMVQVPLERRIENMSWVHLPGTEPRLELTYTMCTWEKVHVESLPL